ncbi:MAG: twin-arginine translocase subunit TatC [Chloroflexi bacterium]|nr:twin-arginine translocase subunit TatC [Chloroflexota bacterium]
MPDEKRMGVLEHLDELRSRLIIALIAILVTTLLAYTFSDAILNLLRAPAGGLTLKAFSPLDGFMIRFRVALYGGIFLAAPVWIFQLMRYIEPALLPSEKRFLFPGTLAMVVLFLLGNVFGYLMLLNMFEPLTGMFGTPGESPIEYFSAADPYISFVTYFMLATGLGFELPIVIFVLIKLGIVSPEALRKRRKIAWFIIFVIAQLITPVADPIVAPTLVMIPMILLFEFALFFSRNAAPKSARAPSEVKTA